jgi:hypothetical protein
MEMYGVIETLQKTVQELKGEKDNDSVAEKLLEEQQIAQSQEDFLLQKSDFQSPESQFDSLVCSLQEKLTSVMNDPQMLLKKRQNLLDLAIADLRKLKNLYSASNSS